MEGRGGEGRVAGEGGNEDDVEEMEGRRLRGDAGGKEGWRGSEAGDRGIWR